MRLRSALILWVTLAPILGLPSRAGGQATVSFAQLSGTIKDTSGRAIAGRFLRHRAAALRRSCLAGHSDRNGLLSGEQRRRPGAQSSVRYAENHV